MAKIHQVNLLFTKESAERRRKITKYVRSIVLIVAIFSVIIIAVVELFAYNTKKELQQLLLLKQTITTELTNKQQQASEAIIIDKKSQIIKNAIQEELSFNDYLKQGNNLLSVEIAQGFVTKIDLNEQKIGLYELRFASYDELDLLLRKLDSLKSKPAYKKLQIEKISINEGTESSSLLLLKILF